IGLISAVRCPFLWTHATACTDRTPGPLTQDYPASISIDNNTMDHFGRFEKQTAGVNLGITESDTVRHNTIHDCPRAGININTGRFGGHEIAYNWVYNDMLESSDHGPFNSWGRDRNLDFKDDTTATTLDAWKTTVIHHNRFETKPGNFGIDLDDQSSNYLQYDNLLIGGGLKMQWHRYNTYTNNILLGGANVQMHGVWFGSQDVVTHNVFTSTQPYYIAFFPPGSYLPDTIKAHVRIIDSNCLAGNSGVTSNEGNYTLTQWKTAGLDVHSVSGDPQFTDVNKTWAGYAPKGDYTVKSGSPALAIGFKNFPMDSFGVVTPIPTDVVRNPHGMDRYGVSGPGHFGLQFEAGGLIISHDGDYQVRIATLEGRTVRILNGKNGANVYLNTHGMGPGIYLAIAHARAGVASRMFIVD
ncbi:MAG: peptide-binding protein, partial [Verrucomicrobiales bacterium]|nr:peptide-binding protein [Verrucomicrobiales bacterium]